MSGIVDMRMAFAAAAIALASSALADDVVVNQERKKFSATEITLQRRQPVTFVNSDPFTHNVYSVTPGMSFDLQVQKPGQRDAVTFEHAGEVAVQCAIHPQMKLKITVTP
jgi:plastocyanin